MWKISYFHKKHGLKLVGKVKEEKIKELENKIEKIRNDIIRKNSKFGFMIKKIN